MIRATNDLHTHRLQYADYAKINKELKWIFWDNIYFVVDQFTFIKFQKQHLKSTE